MNTFDDANNQPSANIKRGTAWVMIINATLGMFVFGYVMSVMNTVQDYLSYVVFRWDKSEALYYTSLFNSLVTIGAGLGAFTAGNLAKSLGRRRSMLLSDALSIAGIIFTLFPNAATMLIGRLLCGFSVGLQSALVPLYVQEVAPLAIKGIAGSFIQLQVCIGSLVAYLFGFGLPDFDSTLAHETNDSIQSSEWWRFMLGFPMIFNALRLFNLWKIFRFDTPTYLVNTKRDDEAKKSLGKIYSSAGVTEQYQILETAREQDVRQGPIKYSTLIGPQYRSRFFIACFISFLQQFTGVNALIFYSTRIFKQSEASQENDNAVVLTTLFAVFNLSATMVSGQVIKRFGRKTILIVGDIAICTCLITIATLGYTGQLDMIKYPIMIYIIIFGLSFGPVVWIFVAEVLPDIGVGCAMLVNWLGAFIVAQFFQPLADAVGTNNAFLFFGIYCLLSLIVIVRNVKETKDLSAYQISKVYQGESQYLDISRLDDSPKYDRDDIVELMGPEI